MNQKAGSMTHDTEAEDDRDNHRYHCRNSSHMDSVNRGSFVGDFHD